MRTEGRNTSENKGSAKERVAEEMAESRKVGTGTHIDSCEGKRDRLKKNINSVSHMTFH